MLHLHVITEPIERTLDAMTKSIAEFGSNDMPLELVTWQADDMHRRFPNMEKPDEKTASTEIWPRSRTYEQTHRATHPLPRRMQRPLSPKPRLIGATGKPVGHHPILRPELFEKLCKRMDDLLERRLKWRSTSQP